MRRRALLLLLASVAAALHVHPRLCPAHVQRPTPLLFRGAAACMMAAPPRIVTLNSAASAAATLLYLPDIALTDAAIKKQVKSLSQFTVKSLVVPPDDRTKFDGLASLVATTIKSSEHPVILIGDSFGGALALFVAHRCKSPRLSGIVLINPATSVELSNIPFIVPQLEALSRLPTPLATAAYNAPLPVALAATLSGSQPFARSLLRSASSPPTRCRCRRCSFASQSYERPQPSSAGQARSAQSRCLSRCSLRPRIGCCRA